MFPGRVTISVRGCRIADSLVTAVPTANARPVKIVPTKLTAPLRAETALLAALIKRSGATPDRVMRMAETALEAAVGSALKAGRVAFIDPAARETALARNDEDEPAL